PRLRPGRGRGAASDRTRPLQGPPLSRDRAATAHRVRSRSGRCRRDPTGRVRDSFQWRAGSGPPGTHRGRRWRRAVQHARNYRSHLPEVTAAMDTAIAIRFLAGRYHATPWDRQVNEAEVEWPPSPWRLLRSFIAIWHRKVSPSGDGEAILESLVGRLASELPLYRLPAATHAHSRHYMPGRGGDADRSLVFDAWTSVDRDDELVVFWPNLDLPEAEGELLKQIVERL